MPALEQQYLGYPDAARYIGVSQRTLWSLVNDSKIQAVRIGKAVRFDVDDLRKFMDAHKTNVEASK